MILKNKNQNIDDVGEEEFRGVDLQNTKNPFLILMRFLTPNSFIYVLLGFCTLIVFLLEKIGIIVDENVKEKIFIIIFELLFISIAWQVSKQKRLVNRIIFWVVILIIIYIAVFSSFPSLSF